ncbi:MAG: Gx transporter family protein [Erysipelotrichaceae bacterium]
MRKTKRMTYITMLAAIAIVFHLVESMIPIPVPVPGFKFGLANIVGLIALYLFDFKVMIIVNIMRIVIASLLRGIIFGTPFWLSLSGVMFSCIFTYLAYRYSKLSIYGVSMVGSLFHAFGQVLMVSFIYSQFLMASLMPILFVLSVPTGLITGHIANMVLKRLK